MQTVPQNKRQRDRRAVTRSWSSVQVSRVVDLTKLRCTPRERCMPAQARQMNTPYGTDAHVGFFAGQSKQTCDGVRSDWGHCYWAR